MAILLFMLHYYSQKKIYSNLFPKVKDLLTLLKQPRFEMLNIFFENGSPKLKSFKLISNISLKEIINSFKIILSLSLTFFFFSIYLF
jgi:hypothetical protein